MTQLSMLLVTLLFLFASPSPDNHEKKPNPFVGTWKLVSVEDNRPPTKLFMMGKNPHGRIIYTKAGQMSVHITRNPQDKVAMDYDKATDGDVRTAYEQYYAYFGGFSVDWGRKVVIHQVEGSLRPNEVGLRYERAFTLEGDRLTLVPMVDGKPLPAKLTWERMKEK